VNSTLNRLTICLGLLWTGLAPGITAQVDPLGRSVLFIRGADGSGGATEGGTFQQRTEQLSDVTNLSTAPGNHGYGYLKILLENDGFQVSQIIESPAPLTLHLLIPHRIVVFGSNNRSYAAAEVQAFHDYMDRGGAALFISDANWGPTWGGAPSSDNAFLARYGAQVYQDSGQVPHMKRADAGRYLVPSHPVLSGPDGVGGAHDVNEYDGEGVNLFQITTGSNGYQAFAAVSAAGLVKRLNTQNSSAGPLQAAGPNDAAMIVVEKGDTRLVGHFDRNTFFNLNGAGTNLTRLDNAGLALGIFRFLASVPATSTPAGPGCGLKGPVGLAATRPVVGQLVTFTMTNATANAPGQFVVTLGPPAPLPFPGGCVLQINPATMVMSLPLKTDAAGRWALNFPLPDAHGLSGLELTAQAATFVAGGPLFGAAELSNGAALRLGYPR